MEQAIYRVVNDQIQRQWKLTDEDQGVKRIAMNRFQLIVLSVMSLWAFQTQANSSVVEQIADTLESHSVTVIGEIHRRKESIELFKQVAISALKAGRCLSLAFEIESGQQVNLEAVLQGQQTASSVHIAAVIDHPALRHLLGEIGQWHRDGLCVSILAVDGAIQGALSRDKSMFLTIKQHISETPILLLVGSVHTLFNLQWSENVRDSVNPYLGGMLKRSNIKTTLYLQRWSKGQGCQKKEAILITAGPEFEKLQKDAVQFVNVDEPVGYQVTDGVIYWACSE